MAQQAAKPGLTPEKQASIERGRALAIAGWLVLLANIIVLFYLPAAAKLGRERPYEFAVAALIIIGVLLIMTGRRMQRAK